MTEHQRRMSTGFTVALCIALFALAAMCWAAGVLP